jgi:transposase
MNRYIGIDAHDKSCTLVVLEENGRENKRAVLETNGELIRDFVQQVPKARHVAFEEGSLSQWLYELLEPVSQEIVVFVPPKHEGQKNDYRDACQAAEGLRTRALKHPVFKPGRELAALRSAVRTHHALVRDLTRAKVRLKSVFRARAVFVGDDVYEPEKREKLLELLPAPERATAKAFAAELDALQPLLADREKALRDARTPEVARLETVPGIGLGRASTIVAVVGTPDRFRTRSQFWSYCGLGLIRWTSSDWTRGAKGQWTPAQKQCTRGLNRNRNASLKDVFKGAALSLLAAYPENPLAKAYHRRVDAGMDSGISRVTLARQIAALTLAMWKSKEDYDPKKYATGKMTTD